MNRDDIQSGSPEEHVQREAAEWMARRDRGLSESERREYETWLSADPLRPSYVRELELTWQNLELLEPEAFDVTPTANSPAQDRPQPHSASATAVSLRRNRWAWLTGAAAAVVLIAAAWWIVQPSASPDPVQTYATAIGEQREVTLADGSIVVLNTRTQIEVQFSEAARIVRLRKGEAHFAVAKMPDRPFLVVADQVSVRAVGTAFGTRLREHSVDVVVTEGRVALNNPADSQVAETPLNAGQRARATWRSGSLAVEVESLDREALERALQWRMQRIDFKETPLIDAVAELNRYNQHQLVVATPETGATLLDGRVDTKDPQAFVRMLELSFDIVAEPRGSDETVLRKR
jgi:transmembrane sensor